jgi:hypothetical protein
MQDLIESIEERKLLLRCWHCDWNEQRTLSWFSGQRHMNCPQCESIIVLDTSDVRRELARQRRQLSELRDQIAKLLGDARKRSTLMPGDSASVAHDPLLELAIAKSHPDILLPSMRGTAAARRHAR